MKNLNMRRGQLNIVIFLCTVFSFTLTAQVNEKQFFVDAKNELEDMLAGKKPLDYERAVFITENPFHSNAMSFGEFKKELDIAEFYVLNLMKKISTLSDLKPQNNILISKDSLDKNCYRAIANYAIFRFITDTTYCLIDEKLFVHFPYKYSYDDPLATHYWQNSQLNNLLNEETYSGNCNALTTLFKILSIRLNSNANLNTTQGHIFISHADINGIVYNVELASKAFPGTGSIETITHTSDEAARNGISMRELNLKQSVGICLLNLAKSYQYKFHSNSENFMFECAELVLKYDPQNLNAMLLKAETLESNLVKKGLPFAKIKSTSEFISYEKHIIQLYKLGYREMPTDMKNEIIAAITKDSNYIPEDDSKLYLQNAKIKKEDNRNASLSNGKFEESDIFKPQETFFRTIFDAKKLKIIGFKDTEKLYKNYNFDPVVFAWNVDPLFTKFPDYSPYVAFANNPILFIDSDGREIDVKDPETGQTHIYVVGAEAPKGASKFVIDTYEALNYLAKNPTRSGVNIVSKLVKTDLKINISETKEAHNTKFQSNFFTTGLNSSAGSDLLFNSTETDVFANGKIQSPIVSLAHELDHANRYRELRDLYNKTESDYVYNMLGEIFAGDNTFPLKRKEEQRAAKGYEADIAKKLGMFVRTNYFDKAQDPVSTYKTDNVKTGEKPAPAPARSTDSVDPK